MISLGTAWCPAYKYWSSIDCPLNTNKQMTSISYEKYHKRHYRDSEKYTFYTLCFMHRILEVQLTNEAAIIYPLIVLLWNIKKWLCFQDYCYMYVCS